jgi:hypothetical protein
MWCCFHNKKNVKWKEKLEEHVEEIFDNVENRVDDVQDNVEKEVNQKVDDLLNTVKVQIEEQIENFVDTSKENEVNTNSGSGMTNSIKEIGITREFDLSLDMDVLSEESLNDERKDKVRPDTPVSYYSLTPKVSLRSNQIK